MAEQMWEPEEKWYSMIDGEYMGVRRVREALAKVGVELGDEIISSRDPHIAEVQQELGGLLMPVGIDKAQIPIVLDADRPVYLFITVGAPNAVVPMHVHQDDRIWRIILAGSIIHDGIELTQGDWFYVPRKKGYGYTVGKLGCILLHTYH